MNLSELKGVGKTRLQQLNDAGIFCMQELLNYFPKKYYDFTKQSGFFEDYISRVIFANLLEEPKVIRFKGLNYTSCKMIDSYGNKFTAIWYNQPYIKATLNAEESYYLYGKNSPKKKNTFVVQLTKCEKNLNTQILPVYKKIGSFGTNSIQNLIVQVLDNYQESSILNQNIINKYNLITLKEAYKNIHLPDTAEGYKIGKHRLDIERLVPLAVKNLNQQVISGGNRYLKYKNLDNILAEFTSLLTFSLTADQVMVINDILKDLSSDYSMNRLLQGEVGSGKTIVSFFGLFAAAKNEYQSAIIAPTEILASQHYNNLIKVFSGTGLKILHLSGSLTPAEKREKLRLIKLGLADIVVGTHAVLGDKVVFKNLAFCVIDEQHRFGVSQRAKLALKGINVDTLVMSATPIPRSMALAIYGNLSLSVISSCPFAKDISTSIVSTAKQPDMWRYVLKQITEGSKAFVVCANIGDDDDDESASATNMYKKIVNLFGKQNVGLLHGKLSKEAQKQVMVEFATGNIKVLVSTTIVEVGVDIPEADIIILASPEKFGLATLHQLRGRVGRNGSKSYCFCLSGNLSQKSLERLVYFRDHSSGFDIAEYDYNTRGAGDIYGTSQHGLSPDFSVNFANYDLALKIASDPLITTEEKQHILQKAEQDYSKLCNDIVLN